MEERLQQAQNNFWSELDQVLAANYPSIDKSMIRHAVKIRKQITLLKPIDVDSYNGLNKILDDLFKKHLSEFSED